MEKLITTPTSEGDGTAPPKAKYNSRLARARAANKKSGRFVKLDHTDDEDEGGEASTRTEASDEISGRMEELAVSPPSASTPKLQAFPTGSYVMCKRSSGAESYAKVMDYDAESGVYDVEFGANLNKRVLEASLRAATAADVPSDPIDYPPGSAVMVKRSNGGESLSYVKAYDPTSKLYTVEIGAVGSREKKRAPASSLRAAPEEEPPPPPPEDDEPSLI